MSILKKKVYPLVDTEDAHSQSRRRIKHLEDQFQLKTVPNGLKIKPVKAKSKSEDLQKKFDNILLAAEFKLLEAMLENLHKEFLETEHSIARCKEEINTTIARWRSSLPLKDTKSKEKAHLLATHAKKFVEDFYFQCTANKTSKALQDALNKEEKAKTQQSGMEAEVQRLSSQKGSQNSRGRSKRKDNAASNGVNKSQLKNRSLSKS